MLTHQRFCCVFLGIISLWISAGAGDEVRDGLGLYKDLLNKESVPAGFGSLIEAGRESAAENCKNNSASFVDYPQLPSYLWSMDLDGMTEENKKRSHKFKSEWKSFVCFS